MPYPMIYSPLYRLRSKKKLTQLLKLPSGYFNKLVNLNEQYTEFCLPKKDGKKNRYFSVPHNEAEYIQKRLFTLLERIERPEWVKAGKKGESYISNAAEHTEGKYGFKMDIAAFYDSVSFAKIRECFLKKFKMSSDIAEIMTLLVTYRRKIPTGGAASMLASYFAYEDMFIEIFDYAKGSLPLESDH